VSGRPSADAGDIEVGSLYDAHLTLLALRGELDVATAGALTEVLDRAAGTMPGRSLLLDLAAVSFLDLRGCRPFGLAQTALAARGDRVVLAGARPAVLRVLHLLEWQERLPHLADVGVAYAALAVGAAEDLLARIGRDPL